MASMATAVMRTTVFRAVALAAALCAACGHGRPPVYEVARGEPGDAGLTYKAIREVLERTLIAQRETHHVLERTGNEEILLAKP